MEMLHRCSHCQGSLSTGAAIYPLKTYTSDVISFHSFKTVQRCSHINPPPTANHLWSAVKGVWKQKQAKNGNRHRTLSRLKRKPKLYHPTGDRELHLFTYILPWFCNISKLAGEFPVPRESQPASHSFCFSVLIKNPPLGWIPGSQ